MREASAAYSGVNLSPARIPWGSAGKSARPRVGPGTWRGGGQEVGMEGPLELAPRDQCGPGDGEHREVETGQEPHPGVDAPEHGPPAGARSFPSWGAPGGCEAPSFTSDPFPRRGSVRRERGRSPGSRQRRPPSRDPSRGIPVACWTCCSGSTLGRVSGPLTVAGPRRSHTGLPTMPRSLSRAPTLAGWKRPGQAGGGAVRRRPWITAPWITALWPPGLITVPGHCAWSLRLDLGPGGSLPAQPPPGSPKTHNGARSKERWH